MRQGALRWRHIEQRQALALAWDEVPVEALVILKREGGPGVLLRRQRRQKMLRRPASSQWKS